MLPCQECSLGIEFVDVGNRWQSSNGPGWSQDLAAGWNASLYSFAFSGATCDQSVNGTPSIVDQVEMYYHQHLDLPPEETVYAFWIGHDDIHEAIQANKSGMKLKMPILSLSDTWFPSWYT